jgi:8-oxo-dGTP diphosphatase
MIFLKEIKDNEVEEGEVKIREASRAVLFDENGLVPLLFVSKYNFHKLPGGGIDKGENRLEGLIREVLEEVGCTMEVTGEVGEIIEYRSEFHLKQTSYCYTGKVLSKGTPHFTEKELNEGFQIVWMKLETAILKVENDEPSNYEGSFIQKRDLVFLKTVLEMKEV